MSSSVVRRYAAVSAAGALMGALWVGVLGRVVMAVIARANPGARGLRSDDDFVIGQFTVGGSLNFLVLGIGIGTAGGAVYLVLRGLRIGPQWFQLLSVTLGPAVVGLAMLVHPTGLDFTLLRPLLLSVGLFAIVIWGYTLSVVLLAERWLRDDGMAASAPPWAVGLMLVPSVLILPIAAAVLIVTWLAQQIGPEAKLPAWPAWLIRLGLAAVFALSVSNLASDLATLA